MKLTIVRTAFFMLLFMNCSQQGKHSGHFYGQLTNMPSLSGKPEYLASPFVTAGDRVYLVGFQDGSFPALGWHIKGEMGGIWDHPVKLMDGFSACMTISGSKRFPLP